jgi:uncharacterized protein
MILRRVQALIQDSLRHRPGVVLLGPRQVGKTTLAKRWVAEQAAAALYLDMERPVDQRRLDDADAFLRAQAGKLVIIDEIHRAPGLFAVLRGIIDDRRAAGDKAVHSDLLISAILR